MDRNELLGITQALASMIAQNSNSDLPKVDLAGSTAVFSIELPAGWVRCTVSAMDGVSDPPPVYDTTGGK